VIAFGVNQLRKVDITTLPTQLGVTFDLRFLTFGTPDGCQRRPG